jgi:DNA polymerase-3 subunit beta
LQTAARIASSRSAVQALSGVLVSAAGDYLELQATDMEVSLRVRLSASVEEPGEVVLPARLLLDIVRSLPGASVTLAERSDHHDVEIASGNAVFAVRTLRRDDFPRLPEPPTGGVQLAAQAFVDTIARVARSASRDDTRPVLTGIMVHASGGELRMVATDSYRLSVKTTALDEAVSDSFEANVPARALQELSRIVAQSTWWCSQFTVPAARRRSRHA